MATIRLAGARSLVGVPMLKKNEVVGVISIYRQEVRPFADQQIELLKSFAAQAVIAIENTRLLNELRQRTNDLTEALEQQTATSEVLGVISSSPGELEPVFQALLDNATQICAAQFGSMVLFEGSAFRRVALHNAPAAFVQAQAQNPVVPLTESPTLSRVAVTKQVIQVTDILAEHPEEAIAKLGGARTVLCVPLLKDDTAVARDLHVPRGGAAVHRRARVQLVRKFRRQAVIAIETPRLLDELRDALQQQTATADVLRFISRSTFDLNSVLQTLVEIGRPAVRRRQGDNHATKDGVFYRAESYGFSAEFMDYVKAIPVYRVRACLTACATTKSDKRGVPRRVPPSY